MPSGAPDFGRADAAAASHQVADLAEQAARTGSIVTFHRGGEVIWLDDFEASVLKWSVGTSGTGASVALSTIQSRNGVQSVLLTAGSTANNRADISRFFNKPTGALVGIEASFQIGVPPDQIQIRVIVRDGTNRTDYELFLDFTNDRAQVLNSLGNQETVLDPLRMSAGSFRFHTIKLIFNIDTGAYVRLLRDDQVVDLSAISGLQVVNSGDPSLSLRIRNLGDLGDNDTIYVDDFILTQFEP